MRQYSNIDNEEENTPAESNSTVTSEAEVSNSNEACEHTEQENGNAFNSFDSSNDENNRNSGISSDQDQTDRRSSIAGFPEFVDDSSSLDTDSDIEEGSVGSGTNMDEQNDDANDREEDPNGEIELDEDMGAYRCNLFTC